MPSAVKCTVQVNDNGIIRTSFLRGDTHLEVEIQLSHCMP